MRSVSRCPRCEATFEGTLKRCPFDAAELEPGVDPWVGASLGSDALRIEIQIASGAIGTVYRASDRNGRAVAVKVLSPAFAASPLYRERFLREGRAVARIDHPGVVRVLSTSADDEVPAYLAMDLVAGPTLATTIAEVGPMATERVLELGGQLARALDAAHRAGVIHRDVKPANAILESETGRAVLVDFGLASVAGEVGVTMTGDIVGTPAYMAPEQIRGEEPRAPVDWYALGCVLWEMARGATPFIGKTGAVLDKHLYETPRPPADAEPRLFRMLEGLLAKEPEERREAFFSLCGSSSA